MQHESEPLADVNVVKAKTLTLQSPGGGDPLTFEYAPPNHEFFEVLR